MNIILQGQLDRIEKALTTLVDSIVVYNPSIPAANTLLTADDDLQSGLKQLVQHQKNHARILALHEKISQQNAQITSNITTLVDTRANLLSTPTSLPQKGTRKVPYTELLDYAKHISRYTVPQASQPHITLPKAQPDPAAAVNGDTEGEKEGAEEGKGMGTEALEDEERKWLEPLKQIPFVLWVSDDVIKRGALAQIQAMVQRGEDPAEVRPEGAKDEPGEGRNLGEGAVKVRGEGVVGGADVGAGEGERRQERRVAKPEVFGGLDLYDPMDDD